MCIHRSVAIKSRNVVFTSIYAFHSCFFFESKHARIIKTDVFLASRVMKSKIFAIGTKTDGFFLREENCMTV